MSQPSTLTNDHSQNIRIVGCTHPSLHILCVCGDVQSTLDQCTLQACCFWNQGVLHEEIVSSRRPVSLPKSAEQSQCPRSTCRTAHNRSGTTAIQGRPRYFKCQCVKTMHSGDLQPTRAARSPGWCSGVGVLSCPASRHRSVFCVLDLNEVVLALLDDGMSVSEGTKSVP